MGAMMMTATTENGPVLFEGRRVTRSARATFQLGVKLGAQLLPGDVVALVGELGAGKTQLIRGACEGAAVPVRAVSSPTFAIVATYPGRIPIHHADFYRLGDLDELYATGFFDLVGGDGAVLVEWADRIPGSLPAARLEIQLAHSATGASVREFTFRGTGSRHAALARALSARPKQPTP
jgi:tRNA threonylcarbamoyladenosine biosynthesis protein TsaE